MAQHTKRTHTHTTTRRRRNQPRTKVPKVALAALTDPRIRAAIERDSIRWNCSYSWICSTALATFYGVDILTPMDGRKRRKARR